MPKSDNLIIISLGGSLIAPNEIDVEFLKKFRDLIASYIRRDKRFVIVCGGGKTARKYQKAAFQIGGVSKKDLDWLGIYATKINTYLVKAIFLKYNFKEKIFLTGGWKPGFSTDYGSVLLAKKFGAKRLVNLSNIDFVYDKDPKKFKNAKKIEYISWKEFRKFFPKKWKPGLNAPFDPIAAKEAEKIGLEVAVLNGRNIGNLKNYLDNKNFLGTKIS